MNVLSASEAKRRLPSHWRLKDGKITLFLDFDSFPDCIRFIDAIAVTAEKEQHHPDMEVSWKRLTLTLTTHDAGGLTSKDIAMAGKINTAVKKHRKRILNLKD
ncbi:MAG: 4a-hydroxytetrahydrobiopterin dehydratase [Candidatus Micrarchaeota archaeon]|nr:4a-hydroxytetrahydrobiopterin dehydratase [Candidatus Micrarchaeota archaeon]